MKSLWPLLAWVVLATACTLYATFRDRTEPEHRGGLVLVRFDKGYHVTINGKEYPDGGAVFINWGYDYTVSINGGPAFQFRPDKNGTSRLPIRELAPMPREKIIPRSLPDRAGAVHCGDCGGVGCEWCHNLGYRLYDAGNSKPRP